MTVEDIRYPQQGGSDAPETGLFSPPPRVRTWADLPQPLPVEERVYPPRPPDAAAPRVQDSAPVPVAPPAWRHWRSRALATWQSRSTGVARPVRRRGPRRKSVVLAAVLGFVLGPFGLLYVGWRHLAAALVLGASLATVTVVAGIAAGEPENGFVAVLLGLLLTPAGSAGWGATAAWWRNRGLRSGT